MNRNNEEPPTQCAAGWLNKGAAESIGDHQASISEAMVCNELSKQDWKNKQTGNIELDCLWIKTRLEAEDKSARATARAVSGGGLAIEHCEPFTARMQQPYRGEK
jgi:hypothetical protein